MTRRVSRACASSSFVQIFMGGTRDQFMLMQLSSRGRQGGCHQGLSAGGSISAFEGYGPSNGPAHNPYRHTGVYHVYARRALNGPLQHQWLEGQRSSSSFSFLAPLHLHCMFSSRALSSCHPPLATGAALSPRVCACVRVCVRVCACVCVRVCACAANTNGPLGYSGWKVSAVPLLFPSSRRFIFT